MPMASIATYHEKDGIQDELDAYNPLVTDATNFKTLLHETLASLITDLS
jgi:hypothetical protein